MITGAADINKKSLWVKMGKKIDGQTSTPENLLMGKVPDGHCFEGHNTCWALFLMGILPYTKFLPIHRWSQR